MNTILQKRIEGKSKELAQKYFPNEMNIWARPNYEAQYVESACKEMATFALQNQWISVEEDLPKYDEDVIAMEYNPGLSWEDQSILFAHRSKNPDVCRDKNDFCIYPPTIMKITHWMETPRLEGGEK